MRRRYRTLVAVEFIADEAADSGLVGEILHSRIGDWQAGFTDPEDYAATIEVISIDGVAADPDDPNSPPIQSVDIGTWEETIDRDGTDLTE